MPKILTFSSEWLAFLVFFLFISFFIGLSELLRKALNWGPEVTRKLVHVMVGVLVCFAPFILEHSYWALILAVVFTLVNYLALKSKSFEGMHATERISYGTIYFPIAFGLLVWIYWDRNPAIFLTAMLILAFADTIATLVGERVPDERKFRLWEDLKSVQGSTAFFITAFIITIFFYPYFWHFISDSIPSLSIILLLGVLTALMATLTEAVSRQGSDNLTLTMAAAFTMDITLRALDQGTLPYLLFWMLGFALAFWISYKLRALNPSGAIGAFILGTFLYGLGAWAAVLPLILFFVLSSILSKFADRKQADAQMAAKGSNRDIIQVYANAGIGLILILIWYLTGHQYDVIFFAFLASIAAANADTWETEFGSFSPWLPRHILSWESVPKGFSGGITALGTFGGILGAGLIAVSGMLVFPQLQSWLTVVLIAVAGFLGSIVDSILGATLQGKYLCQVCGKQTEKRIHCRQDTSHLGGWTKLDNDWVNVSCTVSAALIFVLLYILIS